MNSAHLLLALAAILVTTKLLGALVQRFGRPAVLGELIAGVVLGAGALGVFDPADPVLHALAQIGVLVLLFEIGLATDLRALKEVAGAALTVAVVGVALPFAGGYAVARALGAPPVAAVVVGAALTPTSVGVSARVLSDLGRLQTAEGQVVLGAAVFDDIIGLIILAVVAGVIAGGGVTWLGVGRTSGAAVGFVAAALALGSVAIPPLVRAVERVRVSGALGLTALAFALALAWLADRSGSAMIIGAFAAGLVLHPTPQRREIASSVTALGHFFVPIFFAGVGASVDLRALASPAALLLGGALLAVGSAGKILAGFAPWWLDGNKLLVGAAMLPRGEVELIIAQMGLAAGVLSGAQFGAVMLVIAASALVAPVLVARAAALRPSAVREPETREGGVEELVAGREVTPRATLPVSRKDNSE